MAKKNNSKPGATGPEADRGSVRAEADYEVFLIREGRTTLARARDISPAGIGLFTDEKLEPGEAVELKIVLPSENYNMWLRGEVHHCREKWPGFAFEIVNPL